MLSEPAHEIHERHEKIRFAFVLFVSFVGKSMPGARATRRPKFVTKELNFPPRLIHYISGLETNKCYDQFDQDRYRSDNLCDRLLSVDTAGELDRDSYR